MTATIEETTQAGGASVGRIARVIGPVVDVEFPVDAMPEIYNKLTAGRPPRSRSRSPSTSVTAWSARSR